MRGDFLDAIDRDFGSLEEFTEYIREDVELNSLDGDLNVIGSVSDFPDRDAFVRSLETRFDVVRETDDLLLLNSVSKDVPYYVYLHGQFPLFFTTGTKTEDIPKTVDKYLVKEKDMSRMWVSRREMEKIRQDVTDRHPNILMPYFSAKRGAESDVEAKIRPKKKRTFIYHGDDGLKTFSELREQYGVLPNNMKFEMPNEFNFRVSTKGVFTINNGGLRESLTLIERSIKTLTEVKRYIDESEYTEEENKYVGGGKSRIPKSKPWAIELEKGLTETDVKGFKDSIEMEEWEFTVSRMKPSFEPEPRFSSVVVDSNNYGRTDLEGTPERIRVYPRENTGIGQSLRLFRFVSEQIDPNSRPATV